VSCFEPFVALVDPPTQRHCREGDEGAMRVPNERARKALRPTSGEGENGAKNGKAAPHFSPQLRRRSSKVPVFFLPLRPAQN